jgi:hypothetical protein
VLKKDQLNLWPDTPSRQFQLMKRYALQALWAPNDLYNMENVSATHECNWNGITCQSIDLGMGNDTVQAVTEINLSQLGWSGHIVPDLGLLSNLQSVNLQDHNFQGLLHDSIGNWTRPQRFDISRNRFKGPIPHEIGNWTGLVYFDVSANSLAGQVPTALGRWQALKTFVISINGLTGPLR